MDMMAKEMRETVRKVRTFTENQIKLYENRTAEMQLLTGKKYSMLFFSGCYKSIKLIHVLLIVKFNIFVSFSLVIGILILPKKRHNKKVRYQIYDKAITCMVKKELRIPHDCINIRIKSILAFH